MRGDRSVDFLYLRGQSAFRALGRDIGSVTPRLRPYPPAAEPIAAPIEMLDDLNDDVVHLCLADASRAIRPGGRNDDRDRGRRRLGASLCNAAYMSCWIGGTVPTPTVTRGAQKALYCLQ